MFKGLPSAKRMTYRNIAVNYLNFTYVVEFTYVSNEILQREKRSIAQPFFE